MLAVCLGLAAIGCGGNDNKDQAGIILRNGTKLRGEDAKAYCRRFISPDAESRTACQALGVTPPMSPEQRAAEAGAKAEARAQAEADQSEARTSAARPLAPAIRPVARRILKRHYVGIRASDTGVAILTTYPVYSIPDGVTAAVCKAVLALPEVVAARTGGNVLPIYLDSTDGSAPSDCSL
jgi:hypothetical protein